MNTTTAAATVKVEIKHRITGAVLYSADVPESVGSGLWLRWALEKAAGDRANLGGANLGGANMGGAYLRGANLGGAYLRGANLGGANLGGANLGGANMGGAYLRGANLGGANMSGAYLGDANLGGANLGGANLGGANMSGANLRGANLGGANMGGAYLRENIKLLDGRSALQIGPIGSRNDVLFVFNTTAGLYVRAGCFSGTAAEFLAAVNETHGDHKHAADYVMAMAFARQMFGVAA